MAGRWAPLGRPGPTGRGNGRRARMSCSQGWPPEPGASGCAKSSRQWRTRPPACSIGPPPRISSRTFSARAWSCAPAASRWATNGRPGGSHDCRPVTGGVARMLALRTASARLPLRLLCCRPGTGMGSRVHQALVQRVRRGRDGLRRSDSGWAPRAALAQGRSWGDRSGDDGLERSGAPWSLLRGGYRVIILLDQAPVTCSRFLPSD